MDNPNTPQQPPLSVTPPRIEEPSQEQKADVVDPQVTPEVPVTPDQPEAPIVPETPITPEGVLPAPADVPVRPEVAPRLTPETDVEEPVVDPSLDPMKAPVDPIVPPVAQAVPEQAIPTTTPFYAPKQQQVVATPNDEYIKPAEGQRIDNPVKRKLDAQPKVMIMIPLEPGEPENSYHPVGINGYFYYIKKNVIMPVPLSIAKMIRDSFNLTLAVGKDYLINDDNADKKAALT